MKKIYSLLIGLFVFVSLLKAQDTVLYEGFELQRFYDSLITISVPPPGNVTDVKWYNWDADGLADASSATTARDAAWGAALPFSDVDDLYPNGDSNLVIASNSWLVAPSVADNWLITPSIHLGPADTLFWRSAPLQTPRFLDGYQVRLSTASNIDTDFGVTLFTAAEMTGVPAGGIADTVYSNFTFAPSTAFIHGLDGTYIDPCDITIANPQHRGQLKPFFVPLSAYANQNVFIAFVHNSTDDNMISIDDVMIRGNHPAGINENKSTLNMTVFPNPATDRAQLSFELMTASTVAISVFDVTGKEVYAENKGTLPNGRHFAQINTANLAKGFYTVSVQTTTGRSTIKLLVK